MRLHRFFVSEPIGKQTQVSVHSSELVNQIRRVLRLKYGDAVLLFDGSGSDYECEIVDSTDKTIVFNVSSATRSPFMPARRVYLCAAMIKKDKFEWITEKATELGATDIIPISAERSEKKSLNGPRLKKIAVEAGEQSGRGSIPTIHAVTTLQGAIEDLKKDEAEMIAFHTEGRGFERNKLSEDGPVAIFIGPEGGWAPDELDVFHKNDVALVCLGSQILRAETAVIAALAGVTLNH
jgi:16S rRNA (uracil1498-N3)-methyltransferase